MRNYYNIAAILSTLILSGLLLNTGCNEDINNTSPTTTLQTTQFDGAQGSCISGGVKFEVLVDGVIDNAQTQYFCNVAQGQGGQNGTNTTMRTTKFTGALGRCTSGGVKIEVLVNGTIDDAQTQYICNVAQGQSGQSETNITIQAIDFDVALGRCTGGGVKIEVLINGVIQSNQTQYICNDAVNTFTIGDIIRFGAYEQDDNTSNGKEAITWQILDQKSDGQILIISEKVLDVKPYHTTPSYMTWEKSTIRSWLNGYLPSFNSAGTSFTNDNFIHTAFTADEKAKIVTSDVPAHATDPIFGPSPGDATYDKIFLLSVVEARQYFTSNEEREAMATHYAVNWGVFSNIIDGSTTHRCGMKDFQENKCSAKWWLRSPGSQADHAASVNYDGGINRDGDDISRKSIGVRPALWIKYD